MAKLIVSMNALEVQRLDLDPAQIYVIGRSKTAQIQIRDVSFSREHAKIYFENGAWKVELLAKFGELYTEKGAAPLVSLNDKSRFQIPPYTFEFQTVAEDSVSQPSFSANTSHTTKTMSHQLAAEAPISDALLDEDTFVNFDAVQPFLVIHLPDGSEEQLKLEGHEWIIGRSDDCAIPINDVKASRSHCKIIHNENKYFVQDLGSSNGTFLNNRKMKSNKVAPLNSGDVIQFGKTKILFQLRDLGFQKKIDNLPKHFKDSNLPSLSHRDLSAFVPAGIRNLALRKAGTLEQPGAVRVYPPGMLGKKNINVKFLTIGAVVLVCFAYLMSGGKKESGKGQKTLASQSENKSPFQLLPREQQDQVLRIYDLAYKFYIQGKYELALGEVRKIHKVLPEGYLDLPTERDSKELERLAASAIEINRQKMDIQHRQENQQKLIAQVEAIVDRCDQTARPGTSVMTAENCLQPALELDPDNQKAAQIIQRLQQEADSRANKASEQAAYRSLIQRGESLFNTARSSEQKGNLLDSIEAYKRHIASSYPDPSGLKSKSQERVQKLSAEVRQKVDSLLKNASADFEGKNYRDAISKLNLLLKLDPSVSEGKDLINRVSNELNKSMKAIYSDSVLEEDQGNIESAKSLWKKILDTDVPSGAYYRKAQSKMRKYGG